MHENHLKILLSQIPQPPPQSLGFSTSEMEPDGFAGSHSDWCCVDLALTLHKPFEDSSFFRGEKF
jgi:hypothetical protein